MTLLVIGCKMVITGRHTASQKGSVTVYAVTIVSDGGEYEGAIVQPDRESLIADVEAFIADLTSGLAGTEVAGAPEYGWIIASPCPAHGSHTMVVSHVVEVEPIAGAAQAWLN